MKKILLLSLLLIGLLTTCDDGNNIGIDRELNGTWEMTSYSAFLPTLPEINENDIVWTIDVDNNLLSIENTIESEYTYILASGNYEIIITNNSIIISDVKYGYTIENGILILSDFQEPGEPIIADGPIMNFIKVID
jgi:hypothetical protein